MTRWLVALLLFVLAGCGVQPTPVVRVGPAPSISSQGGLTLYFVADGALRPVTRENSGPGGPGGTVGTADPATAVQELLAGLNADEKLRGLVTYLPQVYAPVEVSQQGQLSVIVPLPVRALDPRGADQLVCTALFASTNVAAGGLFLTGTDGPATFRRCPLAY
ncbi:hypothetical protein [Amycolatopsis nigrescens]|uniref:hypothetical protein n=1 Tax=Amycolatopsis nigrescens TaxID=381445 RepID=UPI0003611B9A|nr:hypothetical protein [Amycolatopsis nigrescens]